MTFDTENQTEKESKSSSRKFIGFVVWGTPTLILIYFFMFHVMSLVFSGYNSETKSEIFEHIIHVKEAKISEDINRLNDAKISEDMLVQSVMLNSKKTFEDLKLKNDIELIGRALNTYYDRDYIKTRIKMIELVNRNSYPFKLSVDMSIYELDVYRDTENGYWKLMKKQVLVIYDGETTKLSYVKGTNKISDVRDIWNYIPDLIDNGSRAGYVCLG